MGFFIYDVARRRTPAGQVALVMIVCRSGRMSRRILRISGSKPRSSMRSASSSTKYVTLLTSMMLLAMRSFSRPGVATTISTPFVTTSICSLRLPPPYTHTQLISRYLYFFTSCSIYTAKFYLNIN